MILTSHCQDALEASTEPKRKSTCDNCNRPASRLRPGPTPTERLCDTCYRRLKTAQKATSEGEPVSDDWRKPRNTSEKKPRNTSEKTEAKDALCQNPQCRLPATAKGLQPGPGTERLCDPCNQRWRRALNKLKPGEVLTEDWRQPQPRGHDRGEPPGDKRAAEGELDRRDNRTVVVARSWRQQNSLWSRSN